jgi:hypothetical protein
MNKGPELGSSRGYGWLNELGSFRGSGWLNELGTSRGLGGSMG